MTNKENSLTFCREQRTEAVSTSSDISLLQSLHPLLQIQHIIRLLTRTPPDHHPVLTDRKTPRSLPTTPTLRWFVPYALFLPHVQRPCQSPRAQDVPEATRPQAPRAVGLSFSVDDDLDLAFPTDSIQPALGGLFVAMRDGDEGNRGVGRGKLAELEEGFLGDCVTSS